MRDPKYHEEQTTVYATVSRVSLSSANTRNWAWSIVNSVKPQSKHTINFGNTHTCGLSKPFSPGKCIQSSPPNTLCLDDWHAQQDIWHSVASRRWVNLSPDHPLSDQHQFAKPDIKTSTSSIAVIQITDLTCRKHCMLWCWYHRTQAGYKKNHSACGTRADGPALRHAGCLGITRCACRGLRALVCLDRGYAEFPSVAELRLLERHGGSPFQRKVRNPAFNHQLSSGHAPAKLRRHSFSNGGKRHAQQTY